MILVEPAAILLGAALQAAHGAVFTENLHKIQKIMTDEDTFDASNNYLIVEKHEKCEKYNIYHCELPTYSYSYSSTPKKIYQY